MKNSNMWKLVLIMAGIFTSLAISVGVLAQVIQNRAFSLEEQINTAASDIKVQEKRRVDLIYNLADCVTEYDEHEASIIKDIADSRSYGSTSDVQTTLNAVAEAYPDLKANETYKEFMNELSMTENMISEYRSNFNKQVRAYNRHIRKFPNRCFLDSLGYEPVEVGYLDFDAPVDAPQDLFGNGEK